MTNVLLHLIFLFYSNTLFFIYVLLILLTLFISIILLQLFKEELTQVKEGMKHINDLAHQLAISDVHLSMENARALEHLNSRWKVLQVEFIGRCLLSVCDCHQKFLQCTSAQV